MPLLFQFIAKERKKKVFISIKLIWKKKEKKLNEEILFSIVNYVQRNYYTIN